MRLVYREGGSSKFWEGRIGGWSGLDEPDLYGAGVDRALGEDDEDADFEDARLEARLGKKAVAEARAARARATGSTEISVVPIKERDLPLRPLPDFRALVAVGAHANPQLAGDGMVFFRPIERERFHVVFARADGSEPRAVPGEVRGRGFPPPLAVSPDAARFATSDYDAATSTFHVFEADVATGARTSLGAFPNLPQLAYLAGDHLLLHLYAKELVLLGPARAPVQRVEVSVSDLVRIDEDVALAGPAFYGLYGDRLVELGRVPGTSRVYASGGKVVGENAGRPVELLNVRAAYEAKR